MLNKKGLIEHLKSSGVLKNSNIIEAFEKIDRADFVLEEHKLESYEDHPIPIGRGQTISQPTTVAFMLELLSVQKGDKVLDIGSGSGWTTALLSELVGSTGEVFGDERVSELVEFGSKNLAKYDFKNSKIIQAGDKLGLSNEVPFDKILVSAGADELPKELLTQLKTGGILVIPIGYSVWKIIKTTDEEIEEEEYKGFTFVPLIK